MTPQARKQLDKMARHRPRRYRWAQALTSQKNLQRSGVALGQAVFVVPAALAFWAISYAQVPWLGGAFVSIAALSTLASLLAWLLMTTAFRFAVPVLCGSEFAVTMTYLEQSPEMKPIVWRWLEQSQDGMLSPYQLKLILGYARAHNIPVGSTYEYRRSRYVALNEAFYAAFPKAPRFEEVDRLEGERFQDAQACLNHAVDHLGRMAAHRQSQHLEAQWSTAEGSTLRARL